MTESQLYFNENGRIQKSSVKMSLDLQNKFKTSLITSSDSELKKILKWYNTEYQKRTLSPHSEITVYNHISEKFRTAPNKKTVKSAHSCAPWHPLAPISLALSFPRYLNKGSIHSNSERYLCELSLKRLKSVTPESEGWKQLSQDALYAAYCMKDFRYNLLARQAALVSYKRDENLYALRLLTEICKGKERLTFCRKLLDSKFATISDLSKVAFIYAKENNPKMAVDLIQQAHRKSPNNKEVFYYEGWIMINLNSYQKALEAFKTSQGLCEKPFVNLHLGLACAYHHTQDPDQAVEYFYKAYLKDSNWNDESHIRNMKWPKIQTETLLNILKNAVVKYPELGKDYYENLEK